MDYRVELFIHSIKQTPNVFHANEAHCHAIKCWVDSGFFRGSYFKHRRLWYSRKRRHFWFAPVSNEPFVTGILKPNKYRQWLHSKETATQDAVLISGSSINNRNNVFLCTVSYNLDPSVALITHGKLLIFKLYCIVHLWVHTWIAAVNPSWNTGAIASSNRFL